MFLKKVYIIGIFKKEMVKMFKNTKTSKTKTNFYLHHYRLVSRSCARSCSLLLNYSTNYPTVYKLINYLCVRMKSHSNFLETRRGLTAQHTTGVTALVVVLTNDRR